MYLLVKIISRLFLSSKKQRGGQQSGTFYHIFRQYAQHKQQQNRNRSNSGNSNNDSQHFDEIQEAEFEEITDDEETTSKTSD